MSMPSFVGMWAAMMVPMMLPSLMPMLWRYRRSVGEARPARLGGLIALVGAGYFFVWTVLGTVAFALNAALAHAVPAGAGTALRHGLRLGLHCSQCCVGPMAVLLVIGVMDLRAMAVVTAAITVERYAADGERFARATGAAGVGAGLFLVARAAGLA